MVYVTSDLHGFPLEKFKKFLNNVGFCKDDTLYILGDVLDRGPYGIELLKWIMQNKNIQLILGNHENMLLECDFPDEISEATIAGLKGARLASYRTWVANSGGVTMSSLLSTRDSEVKAILKYLRETPLYKTITVNGKEFWLVHSGLGNFEKNKKLSDYLPVDLLWTRPSLNTRYFDDVTTVVFGHTPSVCYGNEYLGKIVKTDTWINVDVGVGIGQEPVLLRLNDMKEFYYKNYI